MAATLSANTEGLLADRTATEKLVRAAQRGDREAFGELVSRYERVVYRVALARLKNHAEAQELCQEVFVQVLRKIRQLRAPECFGGWVRAIANRMAINRISRRAPALSVDPSTFGANCADGDTPLELALVRERAVQVRAGLGRLGEMDRETLMAFYVDGQSLAQMSHAFDSPVGTIKRRLHVARKRLARELESIDTESV